MQQTEIFRENTLSDVTEEAELEDHETSFGPGNMSRNHCPTYGSNTSEIRSDGDI